MLSLTERAWAEELYLNICRHIQYDLDPRVSIARLLMNCKERMSDKFYVNFSLFQSLPDAWGIDHHSPCIAN